MRFPAIVPPALLCVGVAPPNRPASTAPRNPPLELPPSYSRMNLLPDRKGCVPIPRQVAGEDRRHEGARLDQQPPGRLISPCGAP